MEKINKLIEAIKDTEFCVNYTTDSNCVLVQEKIKNNYLFEFVVRYFRNFHSVISSTYEYPDEFSVNYEPLEISDFVIYDNKNNIMEFSENEYDLLQIEIEKKIL